MNHSLLLSSSKRGLRWKRSVTTTSFLEKQ
jgi:hypothetical protein